MKVAQDTYEIKYINGTPLQYSCLENPMDGGAWWAADHGIAKRWTRLSDFTFIHPWQTHALKNVLAFCRVFHYLDDIF